MSQHLAILGAGPIGIEAALYARALGLSVTLYDRGVAAANVADWGHVHLFTPWRMNVTTLGVETLRKQDRWPEFPADVCPSGAEFRQHYLLPLTECEPLRHCLRLQTRILRVGHEAHGQADASNGGGSGFRLLVEDEQGIQRVDRADVVIDCTGTYGHHRWAGRGGIPAPGEMNVEDEVFYTLPDPAERDRARFVDRHTLLLGCGYSAATFLKDIELLNRSHPLTKVTWAIRRPGQALQMMADDPLPARRRLVEASLRMAEAPPEWLRFLGSVALESIDYAHGVFAAQLTELEQAQRETQRMVKCDNVVALVGYSPDTTLYDQLQIHSGVANAGSELITETSNKPESNFHILGAKSYGTNSNFLIQVGHGQIREVFKRIQPNAPVVG